MSEQREAIIIEQGNGLPDIGDHVVWEDYVYAVADYIGGIRTDRREGNYNYALIKPVCSLLDLEEDPHPPALVYMVQYRVVITDEDDMEDDRHIDPDGPYNTQEEAEDAARAICREGYSRGKQVQIHEELMRSFDVCMAAKVVYTTEGDGLDPYATIKVV